MCCFAVSTILLARLFMHRAGVHFFLLFFFCFCDDIFQFVRLFGLRNFSSTRNSSLCIKSVGGTAHRLPLLDTPADDVRMTFGRRDIHPSIHRQATSGARVGSPGNRTLEQSSASYTQGSRPCQPAPAHVGEVDLYRFPNPSGRVTTAFRIPLNPIYGSDTL